MCIGLAKARAQLILTLEYTRLPREVRRILNYPLNKPLSTRMPASRVHLETLVDLVNHPRVEGGGRLKGEPRVVVIVRGGGGMRFVTEREDNLGR